jgi:hypothetical protein
MFYRIATIKLAIVVLICVLCLFFFPAARGSFSSTHGPVTGGRSRFYAFLLTWCIRIGGCGCLFRIRSSFRAFFSDFADTLALFQLFPRALAFDLRC